MKSLNAIVKNYTFSYETFNCFTFSIELEMGGGNVSALGSYKLANITPYENTKNDNSFMSYFFSKIFEVFSITDLKDIIGKPVRAIFKNDGKLGDVCIGVQHFLKDGIFFIPQLYNDVINDTEKNDALDVIDLFDSQFEKDIYIEYDVLCKKTQNLYYVIKNYNNLK